MMRSLWQKEEIERKATMKDNAYWSKVAAENGHSGINAAKANQTVEMAGKIFQFHVVKADYFIGRNYDVKSKGQTFQFRLWVTDRQTDSFIGQYWMGESHNGKFARAEEIFSSLVGDACMARKRFNDFCDNLGYSRDSREAEKVYDECTRILEWFHRNGVYDSVLGQMQEYFQDVDSGTTTAVTFAEWLYLSGNPIESEDSDPE